MSIQAQTLVWERARAGKTDLLLLIKLADLVRLDGRDAWIETPAMARAMRMSERGALYVLHRLQEDGEIEIEINDGGRKVILPGGRAHQPKWFIHVRCLCAWEEYREETKNLEKLGKYASVGELGGQMLRRGRPTRKSSNPQSFHTNPNQASEKSAQTRAVYKEGSVRDPVVEPQASSVIHNAAAVLSRYATGWQQRYHRPADISAGDRTKAEALVQAHPLDELLAAVEVYLDKCGFYADRVHPFALFHHNIGKLVVATLRPTALPAPDPSPSAAPAPPIDQAPLTDLLKRLKGKVNRLAYFEWFKDAVLVEDADTRLVVQVPTAQQRDWIAKHYSQVVAEAVLETARPRTVVEFIARGDRR